MRPPEVLDHQATLLDYLGSSHYHGFMDGFLLDMERKGILANKPSGAETCAVLANSLRIAQAYHVQRDMMPVLRAASVDLEGTDYLIHDRLPAEHGFLMFEDYWLTRDVWGEQLVISAVQWRHGTADTISGEQVAGIWLTTYTDINDDRDATNVSMRERLGENEVRTLGRWQITHFQFMPYERQVGPLEQMAPEDYAKWAMDGQTMQATLPNDNRMVVALFRLLGQVLVEVADAPVDRATARRMGKKRLPARVQTIKLRRKERVGFERSDEPGHTLQHQFPVRGHWAWRKCSEHHPLAEEYEKGFHARIYIAPYWKGPNDAPILITQKVWSLSQ